ncbi:hypothetical protein CHU94_08060 [Rhodoferax sp. TH121]|uniref:hypothetical protein n=1 Tax=Rhodoferax sp. TH121 TaxID=2022803 RepID=UPI000B96FEFC|nr:hypothetical protein [Rhodoferax sp. TH121]OYQ41056.1 hypothetical protein CHU94_08060 [Rhodoferax sp. TH121]
MTTNLLSVIEQLVGALDEWERVDVLGREPHIHRESWKQFVQDRNIKHTAALAAGKQALEQTQGEVKTYTPKQEQVIMVCDILHRIKEAHEHWGGWSGTPSNCDDAINLLRYPANAPVNATHPQATEQALEQTQWEDSDDVTISVDYFEKLECCRRLLEIIATGDSEDPRKDAEDELVAHGFWNPAHPQATEPISEYCEHGILWDTVCRSCDELPATEPALSCARCGATTGQACNDMGCGHLEAGNGEPAPSTAGERAEVIEDLLMYAGDNGYSHIDYADTMRHAAALLSAPALPPESGNLCANCAADGKCMKRQALCHANGTAMPVGELTDEQAIKLYREAQDQGITGVHPGIYIARAILAAASTQPVREPLTDEELDLICEKALFCRISFQQFARSIEAAHGITKKGEAKEQTP